MWCFWGGWQICSLILGVEGVECGGFLGLVRRCGWLLGLGCSLLVAGDVVEMQHGFGCIEGLFMEIVSVNC